MAAEPDNFEDPEMADLLRRWGRHARGHTGAARDNASATEAEVGPGLFEPPCDRSKMYRALDAIDARVARESVSPIRRLGRSNWFRGVTALAASLLLASAGYYSGLFGGGGQRTTKLVIAVTDLRLSTSTDTIRGEAKQTEFPSGAGLFIHFSVDRPGVAYVAMLDSQQKLAWAAVKDGCPDAQDVKPGSDNRLGRFRLDNNVGVESFVIITSAQRLSSDDLSRVLANATAAASAAPDDHVAKLAAIFDSVKKHEGLAAHVVTFRHVVAQEAQSDTPDRTAL